MSAVISQGGPAERLLSRLEGVRETAARQYMARCPAHDDKSPSLGISDKDDRVLIHCFAGCSAGDVVDAVGLTLADLFDRPLHAHDHHHHHAGGDHRDEHGAHDGHHRREPIPVRQRWDARALIKELHIEAEVVLMAAMDVSKGAPLSGVDQERLRKAVERMARTRELIE